MYIPVIIIVIIGLILLFQEYPIPTLVIAGLLIIGVIALTFYLGKKKGN
jgi:hypothetical protein